MWYVYIWRDQQWTLMARCASKWQADLRSEEWQRRGYQTWVE